jgi:ABC-type transporter Mla subunit MlaD
MRSGRVIGAQIILFWLVLGIMSWGIITTNRQGAKQSKKLEKIIQVTTERSVDARDQGAQQRDQLQRAIQCVLDQFAEHRVTNQAVHDDIARALRVPPTPHTPLPERAPEEQITKICAEFYGGHN